MMIRSVVSLVRVCKIELMREMVVEVWVRRCLGRANRGYWRNLRGRPTVVISVRSNRVVSSCELRGMGVRRRRSIWRVRGLSRDLRHPVPT